MNDVTRTYAPMFADHAAGLYDLPEDVLVHHAGLTRLDAELAGHAAARPETDSARRQVIAQTKTAALGKGKSWPSVAPIREAETATTDHDRHHEVFTQARREMAGELSDLIADNADRIIADYLRPVHDRIVAAIAQAAPLIPEPSNTDALMRGTFA